MKTIFNFCIEHYIALLAILSMIGTIAYIAYEFITAPLMPDDYDNER
jgi:hypothetical protein